MVRIIVLFFPFLITNSIFCQEFEITFGDDTGNHLAYKLFEIPDEDSYISLTIGPSTSEMLSLSKVDCNGIILLTSNYPIPNFSRFSPPDFYISDNYFKVSVVDGDKILVLKYDYSCQLMSEVNFTNTNPQYDYQVKFYTDESVIITEENNLARTFRVIRLSPDGSIMWSNSNNEGGRVPINTRIHVDEVDNSMIITEQSYSYMNFYKFRSQGQFEWKIEELGDHDENSYIIPFPNHESYLIYGGNKNDTIPGFGTYLSSLDIDGNIIWSFNFSDHLDHIDESGVIEGDDNTLILTGKKSIQGSSVEVLLKMNSLGEIIWKKTYDQNMLINEGQLIQDNDDGFVIFAEAYPGNSSSDPYILKTDSEGNLLWTWFDSRQDYYLHRDGFVTEEGKYIFLGNGEDFAPESNYVNYLAKIDTSFVTTPTNNALNNSNDLILKFYPNPNYGQNIIHADIDSELFNNNSKIVLSVYDSTGKIISSKKCLDSKTTLQYLTKGTYSFVLTKDQKIIATRIFIQY